MIKVCRIGHATFDTPDLAKAIDYYSQVAGLALTAREANRAFFASKIGQLAIELRQAPSAAAASSPSRSRPAPISPR